MKALVDRWASKAPQQEEAPYLIPLNAILNSGSFVVSRDCMIELKLSPAVESA